MPQSPITQDELPTPKQVHVWEAQAEIEWAQHWAACANASQPSDIRRKAVRSLATRRYLGERDDPDNPYDVDAALTSMIRAAKKLIVLALDGKAFRLKTTTDWRCRLDGDRLVRERIYPSSVRDPEADLAMLLEAAGMVFPFRRCARCRKIFARQGRQEYCAPACARHAELDRRKKDEGFKKRQRERMRLYRERKTKEAGRR